MAQLYQGIIDDGDGRLDFGGSNAHFLSEVNEFN